MKANTLKASIFYFIAVLFSLPAFTSNAQPYSNVYNGVTYTSSQPYNLNVVYFVPNDVPLDTSYKRRVSENLLWGQNFYKQNMIANGYGAKSFGLFKEAANPNRIKIIKINGQYPHTAYPYENANQLWAEVNAYFTANPSQKTSEHFLIITAITAPGVSAPYYGTGRTCYANDYPKFDLVYLGATTPDGNQFTGAFGGMLHELGHGLNLPHSHQTSTENNSPTKGMNLMFCGNCTLGQAPTFMNRASCALLNNSQTFATAPGTTYYNGHSARITALHATYSGGNIIVSGRYTSNVPVTDINIYQDPFATISPGYYRVAWSVPPIGTDSFYVSMPVSDISGMGNDVWLYDLSDTTINYNMEIELALKNGEGEFSHYPYAYINGVPNINIDFDDLRCNALGSGWAETNVGTRTWGPVPGYVCYTAADNNNIRLKTFSVLYGTNDAFPFAYTTLTGDGSITGRIKNMSSNWNDYGGIMMRNSLNDNDKYVSTGLLDSRGIYDQNRYAAGATTGANGLSGGGLAAATEPVWVKLQRKGNTITSFYSQNGTIWTPYNNYTTTMGNTIYAGMFVSNPTAQADIDFGAVLPCTVPSGWQVADVGTVSAPGTACQTTGNLHMENYGTPVVGSDNFTFMYKTYTGDVNITARIKKVSDGWNTLGGLMIRNTLEANSAFVNIGALDTRGVHNQWRAAAGGGFGWSGVAPWAWPAAMWVRLHRIGNTINTYYATDGINWTLLNTFNVPMNSTAYVGLVSSGMGQASDFDQVWINGVQQTQSKTAAIENTVSASLQIVPNPASSEIHIVLTGSTESMKSVSLLDMVGRRVLQQEGPAETLRVSGLPAGSYIVEVELSNNEVLRQRVIKR